MPSSVADRFRAWASRLEPASTLVRFRMAFGAIWLVYDVIDLLGSGTARITDWLGTTAPSGLVFLQLGLIACELLMVLGEPVAFAAPATLVAALLRGLEWRTYLRLNDFAYYAVTALILGHSGARGGLFRPPAEGSTARRWPRDVLVLQAAWIYFATGLLKLNPSWLSGRHLFVRLEYLHSVLAWPYPGLMNRCAEALPCDAVLAWTGVMGELSLACLLAFHRRRRFALPLAIMIHGFGGLGTNVWFFGPSLVAQIACLTD